VGSYLTGAASRGAGWFSVVKDPIMPRRKSSSALNVLVVDDFEDGLELVAEYLTFRGFGVLKARSGDEAIEIARKVKPQIVLMDLSMPGLDGWQATRILKADPNTKAIRVIAVTAHALKRETDAARDAGCDGIISKPFDLTALADALPRLLTHGGKALYVPGLSLTLPGMSMPSTDETTTNAVRLAGAVEPNRKAASTSSVSTLGLDPPSRRPRDEPRNSKPNTKPIADGYRSDFGIRDRSDDD
jgi:CheY-like chemotaxis protein